MSRASTTGSSGSGEPEAEDRPREEGGTSFPPEQTALLMIATPPPVDGKWTDRQYRPLIQGLVDPTTQARLRHILRRQAWLYQQEEAEDLRDLSLALAAHLATATPDDLVKTPFLRSLVERCVLDFVQGVLHPLHGPH